MASNPNVNSPHLTADFRNDSYWLDAAGAALDDLTGAPETLPKRTEVVVIGAGYTGLSAALELSRAGRDVLVLDAVAVGAGCSSRNGGLVGPSFHKLGLDGLKKSHGTKKAHSVIAESRDCLEFLVDLIENENIDCDLRRSGRFRGADKPEHYEDLAREVEGLQKAVDLEADMVPRTEQRAEIGSDAYHGGVVYHRDGHLHPGQYVAGLAARAAAAGARIVGQSAVTAIRREAATFVLAVGTRRIEADQVLVATNGYTPPALGWFRRRILPIRSAMIATEAVEPSLIRELSPKDRCLGGTSRLMLYYRPSSDGTRMILGGRTFHLDDRPMSYTKDLHGQLVRIFPQLAEVRISHGWSGTVAYTFDHVPHIGQHKGLYYAMGYCGSGVGRSTFYGNRIAKKMMGDPQGATALDDLDFKTKPFYTGTPWFLPAILRWHAFMDKR
ncbi:MAG: FAD-binding oxidoreductase [Gammaproteobacteria bacterium]|nr:FAD-binding oxidoreductase [Gammaproteobacteria bacterium]